jgi:hypothetical protein
MRIAGRGDLLGDEDCLYNTRRTSTARCISLLGSLLEMPSTEFMRQVKKCDTSWIKLISQAKLKTDNTHLYQRLFVQMQSPGADPTKTTCDLNTPTAERRRMALKLFLPPEIRSRSTSKIRNRSCEGEKRLDLHDLTPIRPSESRHSPVRTAHYLRIHSRGSRVHVPSPMSRSNRLWIACTNTASRFCFTQTTKSKTPVGLATRGQMRIACTIQSGYGTNGD